MIEKYNFYPANEPARIVYTLRNDIFTDIRDVRNIVGYAKQALCFDENAKSCWRKFETLVPCDPGDCIWRIPSVSNDVIFIMPTSLMDEFIEAGWLKPFIYR